MAQSRTPASNMAGKLIGTALQSAGRIADPLPTLVWKEGTPSALARVRTWLRRRKDAAGLAASVSALNEGLTAASAKRNITVAGWQGGAWTTTAFLDAAGRDYVRVLRDISALAAGGGSRGRGAGGAAHAHTESLKAMLTEQMYTRVKRGVGAMTRGPVRWNVDVQRLAATPTLLRARCVWTKDAVTRGAAGAGLRPDFVQLTTGMLSHMCVTTRAVAGDAAGQRSGSESDSEGSDIEGDAPRQRGVSEGEWLVVDHVPSGAVYFTHTHTHASSWTPPPPSAMVFRSSFLLHECGHVRSVASTGVVAVSHMCVWEIALGGGAHTWRIAHM